MCIHFTKNEIWMANKHKKILSLTTAVICKLKSMWNIIEHLFKHLFFLKCDKNQMLMRKWMTCIIHAFPVIIQMLQATLKNNSAISYTTYVLTRQLNSNNILGYSYQRNEKFTFTLKVQKGRGYMYTYAAWFIFRFDRKQQNTVKQLSFNKK